ncbi:MAG: N-acetylmuramidase family protein [Muribaculaceae bacterium]|nr:N-acetylmuramidase family protein [Muribaculaceae bacterium]
MKFPYKKGRLFQVVTALAIIVLTVPIWLKADNASDGSGNDVIDIITPSDTLSYTITPEGDTVYLSVDPAHRHGPLTEEDFIEVAEELGVEVAAIKAVVEIEAGKSHKGFWTEGKPLINFDLSMFRKMAAKNKVSLAKATKTSPVIFSRPNIAKYGSQQAAQQARLDAARAVNDLSAIEGTFWGMFQIGGFNWKKCGAKSPDEFVELMSRSERDQLELFANFVRNTGLLEPLRKKNWAAFARGYNGPSYASRGYHTKMANAYARFKKEQ